MASTTYYDSHPLLAEHAPQQQQSFPSPNLQSPGYSGYSSGKNTPLKPLVPVGEMENHNHHEHRTSLVNFEGLKKIHEHDAVRPPILATQVTLSPLICTILNRESGPESAHTSFSPHIPRHSYYNIPRRPSPHHHDAPQIPQDTTHIRRRPSHQRHHPAPHRLGERHQRMAYVDVFPRCCHFCPVQLWHPDQLLHSGCREGEQNLNCGVHLYVGGYAGELGGLVHGGGVVSLGEG
jgi:hypothetical protein